MTSSPRYEGFEELLYKRLERQYPEHKVHRKGAPFPPREEPALSTEEADDEADIDLDAEDGAREEL